MNMFRALFGCKEIVSEGMECVIAKIDQLIIHYQPFHISQAALAILQFVL